MKKSIKTLTLLSICFLIDFAEILILYSFPIILFNGFRDIFLICFIYSLKPLFQILAVLLLKRVKDYVNVYLLMLVSFSLFFVLVILFNKINNILILPVILLLLGLATGLFEIGKCAFVKKKIQQEKNSDLFRILSFSNVFAFVLVPIFANDLILKDDYYAIFNFFAILVAVAGIIFYFAFRKVEKQLPSIYVQLHNEKIISPDVIYIELLKGAVMFIVPLFVIHFHEVEPNLIYAIPFFFLPSLIIKIFFRVFKVNFKEINDIVRYLALSFALFLFFFNQEFNYFLVALTILGFVVALIENQDIYQEKIKTRHFGFYLTASISNIVGIIFMGILSTYWNVNLSLSIIGVVIIIVEIFLTLRNIIFNRKSSK